MGMYPAKTHSCPALAKPAALLHSSPQTRGAEMIRILLVVIVAAALAVPFFNRVEPSLFGFPFFYWYQLAVVLGASLLTWVVYAVENAGGEDE